MGDCSTVKLLLKITAALLLTAGLALASLALLTNVAPQRLVPAIEHLASDYLGRQLQVTRLETLELGEDLSLSASGLSLQNATWAEEGALLAVDTLQLSINLPSLWREGPVIIRRLHASGISADLAQNENGEQNWMLPAWDGGDEAEEDEPDSGLLIPVVLEDIDLREITAHYRDAERDISTLFGRALLQRRRSDSFSELEIEGRINDLAASTRGTIGPADALLSGRDLAISLESSLGKLQLVYTGTVGDLATLRGVDLDLQVQAPNSRKLLDLVGLEEVRDGPLRFSGNVADAQPGLRIDASGRLAEFTLEVAGEIAQPVEADGIELDLALDGPSLQEAGLMFGARGLRDVPYSISGHLRRHGSRLALRGVRLLAGTGELQFDGELPNYPEIDDWQADINGSNVNLAVLGALAGLGELPDLPLEITGRLAADPNGVELLDLQITGPDIGLEVDGLVGELPDLQGSDFKAELQGVDMSLLQPLIGLNQMPAEPYLLSGRLMRPGSNWQFERVRLESGQFTLQLDGEIDRLVNARNGTGTAALTTPNLPAALDAYGIDPPAMKEVPLELRGAVALGQQGFDISNLQGAIADVKFSGGGFISSSSDLSGSQIQLRAGGEDLSRVLGSATELRAPAVPFSLDVVAGWHPPLVDVERLQLKLGEHRLSGRLNLESAGGKPAARGEARLQGPELADLLSMFDIGLPVQEPNYQLHTRILATGEGVQFEQLQLSADNSDLDGTVMLAFGEVPRLDLDLHSGTLDLSFLFPTEEELAKARAEAEAEQLREKKNSSSLFIPPTKAQLADRVIPETPLPLGWVRMVDGNWRYRVDRVVARLDTEGKATMEFNLEGGLLTTRRLDWTGSVSEGTAAFTIDARSDVFGLGFNLDTSRVPMLWLFEGDVKPTQDAVYRARFNTRGNNLREVAANLNGALASHGTDAKINNRNLDLALGDILNSVVNRMNPNHERSPFTRVECHAGALTVTDGLIQLHPGFAMRTDQVDAMASGALDLGDETLGLSFKTRPRKGIGISASKAVTPYIMLAGNLAHPHLTLDPGGVVLHGGAAIATGGLSLVADTLWSRWKASRENPCDNIASQAAQDSSGAFYTLFPDHQSGN